MENQSNPKKNSEEGAAEKIKSGKFRKLFGGSKKIVNIALLVVLGAAVAFAGYNIFLHYKEIQYQNQHTVKFGLINDVHCYSKFDKDKNQWEVNWRCSRPMEEFVKQMNNLFKPDFVIENGDFVDGGDGLGDDGFLKAKEMYEKIQAPKYYVLGNHEAINFSKDRWKEITGYDKTYYYFDAKGYRFIVLDGNFYQDPNDPGKIVDLTEEIWRAHKEWHQGLMNQEQMDWLENLLKESSNYKKIVFIHEPPFAETVGRVKGDIFVNPGPLRDLFSKYGVMAVFAGHTEEICDVNIDGVRYFSLHGFFKKNPLLPEDQNYKDEGVFHQIKIKNNGEIDIEMFFSKSQEDPYQSIKINQDTAICNNKTLPPQ